MDGTATASRTSPRARRLTFARRVCVLVSLLLITPSFHGVAAAVLLVGPLVLAPAGYELSLLFACASVFLSVASWMTRRSGGDSAKGPVTDGNGPSDGSRTASRSSLCPHLFWWPASSAF